MIDVDAIESRVHSDFRPFRPPRTIAEMIRSLIVDTSGILELEVVVIR